MKAPIFPFHTWSPDAYAEAPTGGSVILAAVMAKLGTYGIIRFDLSLFPRAVVDLAPLLLTLGVVGILYGAIVACATRDLKRLVAYSSLAHLGFIVLGTFALTSQALTGSVIQMVNHGLVIALLFIVIGWIYERRKSWQTSELRGLQRPAPILAAVFMVGLLATIGLPGLNGFVGEFLILIGTFVTHRWWAVVATGGVVLAAIYMLWAYQQAFHHAPDAGRRRDPRHRLARGGGGGPPGGPHHLPGGVPEARARPDHPVGRPARPPRRPGHRQDRAGRGHRPGARLGPVEDGSVVWPDGGGAAALAPSTPVVSPPATAVVGAAHVVVSPTMTGAGSEMVAFLGRES